MRIYNYLIVILLTITAVSCKVEIPDVENPETKVTTGVLEIDFKIPYTSLPASKIHRIDLSIARTADSLYRGLFISSANVYDEKTLYRFVLEPGSYYYQAAVTCSCLGDSCLWGGFPGGRYGVRWAIDKVEVALGKVIRESPSFQ
jgi:hypothetical protein